MTNKRSKRNEKGLGEIQIKTVVNTIGIIIFVIGVLGLLILHTC